MTVSTNNPTVEEATEMFADNQNRPETPTMKESTEISITSADRARQVFSQNPGLWTSISLDRPAMILNALGDSDYNLLDFCEAGGIVECADILSHPVSIAKEGEKGEPETFDECLRCVLIDTQGKTYSSVANGVKTSISNIMMIFGLPPFDPPIKIKAKTAKTRRGFKTINLKVIE